MKKGIVRITVETEEDRIVIETPRDNDIWDWRPVFMSILVFLTFHPETAQEIFKED